MILKTLQQRGYSRKDWKKGGEEASSRKEPTAEGADRVSKEEGKASIEDEKYCIILIIYLFHFGVVLLEPHS